MGGIAEFKKKKSIKMLEVKVIEQIDKNKYLVGEETEAMIMIEIEDANQSKLIVDDMSIKLIKPKYIDQNTFEVNPNFKMMIMTKQVEMNVKPKVLKALKEAGMVPTTKGSEETKIITFAELDKFDENTEVPNLVVKVSSVTRPMDGKFSKFKLATIKDKDNKKNNLAIYPPHLDSFAPGKVFKISVVKITNYKKVDEDYHRLSTVRKATIQVYEDKSEIFKNVTTGEFVLTGIVLGHGDIHQYQACKTSWMKVRDNNKCDAHKENKEDCKANSEFVTELYVDAENEVETLHGFSRHFGLEGKEEEKIEELMEKLDSKKIKVEYNVDQDNGEKKRIVEMKIIL